MLINDDKLLCWSDMRPLDGAFYPGGDRAPFAF